MEELDWAKKRSWNAYVIDQPILRGIVFRLQRTEQRLLCTEDLHRTCWVLRQTKQAACVAN